MAALAACSCGSGDEAGEGANIALDPLEAATAADDSRIECALDGGGFVRACGVERLVGEGGLTLTIRHPDGGFRRLLVTGDGRGVVAADGAETAEVTVLAADRIEVTVGEDRYRLPATVKR